MRTRNPGTKPSTSSTGSLPRRMLASVFADSGGTLFGMKAPEVPKRFENFREAVRRGDTCGAGDGQQLFGYTKVFLSQRLSGMFSAFDNSLLLISGSKIRVLVRPP